MLQLLSVVFWLGVCLVSFGAALEGWGFWRVVWIVGSVAAAWSADALGFPGWISAVVAVPLVLVALSVAMETVSALDKRRER